MIGNNPIGEGVREIDPLRVASAHFGLSDGIRNRSFPQRITNIASKDRREPLNTSWDYGTYIPSIVG
jgi:hypothetical protein